MILYLSKNFIQSPIGLVPKSGSDKLRLIFHLSYKFDKESEDGKGSLNEHTPKNKCSVKYNDLDCAIRACLKVKRLQRKHNERLKEIQISGEGQSQINGDDFASKIQNYQPIYMGKTDVQSAFRVVPLSKNSWNWLIMKAVNPVTKKVQYFCG